MTEETKTIIQRAEVWLHTDVLSLDELEVFNSLLEHGKEIEDAEVLTAYYAGVMAERNRGK